MEPFFYKAKCKRVIDGDTIEMEIDLGFHIILNEKFRLARINAPEITGEETPRGEVTKKFLEEILTDKEVIVKSIKTEKFGRWLAEIWIFGENLNDLLVEKKLAIYKEY